MGVWSLYFLGKLGLYWGQVIGLHWLENLLFAAALAWPLPAGTGRRWRALRQLLAVAVALLLLYHDSYLPPWSRVVGQLGLLTSFSLDYVAELLTRLVSWPVVAALGAMAVVFGLLRHQLRFSTLAFTALLLVPVLPPPGFWKQAEGPAQTLNNREDEAATTPMTPAQLEARLLAFHDRERDKAVVLPGGVAPAFDIVVLSVCSLSWDDLDETRLRDAPWLQRFDIVFRKFNAAASYSGPALLRLLRANCGQVPQSSLYDAAPAACYLFGSLAQAGYAPAVLMNHDGRFDKFAAQLRDHGGLGAAPLTDPGAPVAMRAFDGTPIQDDLAVLSRWWGRPAAGSAPRALLYNTITLHDGNRVPGLSSQRSQETFKPRLLKLMSDLERFITLVEASQRPTVLMLVPEHGGALRGDAVQIPGLREIPSPGITGVPVAVKLIGFEGYSAGGRAPISVDRPSSYIALASLLAALLPTGGRMDSREQLAALVQQLPGTDWVAENEGTVLLRQGQRSFLRTPQGQWAPY